MAHQQHITPVAVKSATKTAETKMANVRKQAKEIIVRTMEDMARDSTVYAKLLFEKMDLDGNGRVSRTEFLATYPRASKEVFPYTIMYQIAFDS
jgi:hypothetical protein